MQCCDQTQDLPGLPPGGPLAAPVRPALPTMTPTERAARAQEKRSAVLAFLGSGEVWTSVDVIQGVTCLSRTRAAALAAVMERDGLLLSEVHQVEARKLKIYGITPHGLAMADRCGEPHFERGRTNPSWIMHRLEGQRMRLKAEAAGWTGWQPERALRMRAAEERWKKIPDAVAASPAGESIAIEIERHAKSLKRYAELIVEYILEIKAGRYRRVHFVCPPGVEVAVARAMAAVPAVRLAGETVQLTDQHRSRFLFFNFQNWPPVGGGNHG